MTDVADLMAAIEARKAVLEPLGYRVRFDITEGGSILVDATGPEVTVSEARAEEIERRAAELRTELDRSHQEADQARQEAVKAREEAARLTGQLAAVQEQTASILSRLEPVKAQARKKADKGTPAA